MKKIFLAIGLMTASMFAAAQVDSTSTGSSSPAPIDTTSQATVGSDSTSQTSVSDSTNLSTANVSADTAITDEDLKKYAIVMDSVNGMKQSLIKEISTKVKSNGKMKTSRYNELSKAIDDEAKLKELKATPEEIAFVKEVAQTKADGVTRISDTVESLANDFVGVVKYNKIKSSLETDAQLKSRYDAIMTEVQSDEGTASSTSKPKTSN